MLIWRGSLWTLPAYPPSSSVSESAWKAERVEYNCSWKMIASNVL